MNVLAVDDQINVLNGLMVGVQWKKLGIDQVYKAGNAAEAKRILRACTVDILLSDIEMPGESGLQLLEWVRNEQMDIACIFLTAHADFGYAKTAMRLDSVDYILQPASYTQIEESIQRVIDKINARRIQDTYASYGKRIIRDNASFEKMVVNQWPLEEKLPSTWGENAEEDNIQKIKQVKQYIQQNFDRELHREEIAEQVFLNASYLSRLFSKYTGMSLKEYITFEKMKLAHTLITTTNLSISIIALKVGYTNFSYFSQLYKQQYGVTPSEERK